MAEETKKPVEGETDNDKPEIATEIKPADEGNNKDIDKDKKEIKKEEPKPVEDKPKKNRGCCQWKEFTYFNKTFNCNL